MREKGDRYDERFRRLALSGTDVHGEASFVESFEPATVLDAGCGSGRVAIELARRRIRVTGIDVDPEMLDVAIQKAPRLDWRLGDLASVDIGSEEFDLIVCAGNVLLFVELGTEGLVIANLAAHLADGGLLISGFQLDPRRITLDSYDEYCSAQGLELLERWSTWDRQRWEPASSFAVSVHRGHRGHPWAET
ncbi:MAG: class I SAM-dependent methyltransferase [Acidimicrobiales bacterium]